MPHPLKTILSIPSRLSLGRLFLGAVLVVLGIGLAYSLYDFAGDGNFFRFDRPTAFAPLVAISIGVFSAALVGAWMLNFWGRFTFRHSMRVLLSISLIWLGFGAGLLGPVVLGHRSSWEGVRFGTVESVIYSIDYDRFDMSPELKRFYGGDRPGAYITSAPDNQLWIAVNSSPPPTVRFGQSGLKGEVAIASFSLGPEVAFQELTNLTERNPRIQHLRDIQAHQNGLIFSNIELKSDCMVLQVWRAELARAVSSVDSLELLWESRPCLEPGMSAEEAIAGAQSGGRLATEEDGSILVSVGDFSMGVSYNQDFAGRPIPSGEGGSYGKVLRIAPDGKSDVISSGHRNPQGLFLDSNANRLWLSEHGPNSGGELNLIHEGADYGWDDTTYGIPYEADPLPNSDWKIGRWGSHHEGFEKPRLAWMPSIAPSQLIIYEGDHFPGWKGDILLATLKDESLRRIRLDGDRVVFDERMVVGERVRDIVELDDGRLLLSFDNAGLGVLSLPETQ